MMNTQRKRLAQRKYSQCELTYSSGHYGRVEPENETKKKKKSRKEKSNKC